MARRFSLIAVLTLVCFLPGCFTIGTQGWSRRGSRVFSGTREHFTSMATGLIPWGRVDNSYWMPQTILYPESIEGSSVLLLLFLVPWPPLDLPLSFVADIVILPYTIPAQLAWGDFKK